MPGTPIDNSEITAPLSATSDEVAKQAIQDTARYEEQLVKLILFHDDRALRVLSVYVPVIIALIATAVALKQTDKLTLYIGCMIAGTALSFFVGCICAFCVVWTAPIYLPGRQAPFWKWAIENDIDLRTAAIAFIDQAAYMTAQNYRHSNKAAAYLTKAYTFGVAAPFVGAAIVWVAYSSQH
jgi:cytochrome c biogenesis protein CcdA